MKIARLTPLAAGLLLSACQQVAAPDAQNVVRSPDPLLSTAAVVDTRTLMEAAERLAAEYDTGTRPFPAMSADPRDSVSPETLQKLMEGAERLAAAQEERNAD